MEKLLSFIVPCYNSQDYMEHCIQTLLPGGEEVEILVIDDGSVDNTLSIGKKYEENYPGIVRAIHQKNKGHGGAVNTGIANAKGEFVKVVDSDDWIDEEAYSKVLAFLKKASAAKKSPDMLVSNFIYDKLGAKHKKVMKYHHALPKNRFFQWKDIGHFSVGQYILMHSVIYRRAVLLKSGLKLPEHTFYVDNVYVYQPLPYVKNIYYLDVTLYHYFIGREDQSVQEQTMIKRIDQQLKVNKIMIDAYDLDRLNDKKLRYYMYQYLNIITVISSILLLKYENPEHKQKKEDLWAYLKDKNENMYRELRYKKFLGFMMNVKTKPMKKIVVFIYGIVQKIFGFN